MRDPYKFQRQLTFLVDNIAHGKTTLIVSSKVHESHALRDRLDQAGLFRIATLPVRRTIYQHNQSEVHFVNGAQLKFISIASSLDKGQLRGYSAETVILEETDLTNLPENNSKISEIKS